MYKNDRFWLAFISVIFNYADNELFIAFKNE